MDSRGRPGRDLLPLEGFQISHQAASKGTCLLQPPIWAERSNLGMLERCAGVIVEPGTARVGEGWKPRRPDS